MGDESHLGALAVSRSGVDVGLSATIYPPDASPAPHVHTGACLLTVQGGSSAVFVNVRIRRHGPEVRSSGRRSPRNADAIGPQHRTRRPRIRPLNGHDQGRGCIDSMHAGFRDQRPYRWRQSFGEQFPYARLTDRPGTMSWCGC